jgi:hypothetical protein
MMCISIGGFRFNFTTENVTLTELGPRHRQYPGFLLDPEDIDIVEEVEVTVTSREKPDTTGFEKIFDSGFCWKCYRNGRDYLVEQPHPQENTILLASLFRSESKTISIHCSDTYRKMLDREMVFHPFSYPLDQVAMSFALADNMGGIIHSAGWHHDGGVWLFPGKSGLGKSTIAGLLKKTVDATLFSDDRMVVRRDREGYLAYGTPWAGDENDALNRCAPLKGLLFLRHGLENSITRLSAAEGFKRLMAVMTVPWYDEERVEKMLDFSNALLSAIPAYEFCFTRDAGAVEKLLEFSARR